MIRLASFLAASMFPFAVPAAAQGPPAADGPAAGRAAEAPLFSSDEPLTLTIEGPLNTVFKQRGDESEEFPAVVWEEDAAGERIRFDVQLRTRGNFRLQRRVCEFPPIRVDFKKGAVENTVFAGQDKLKLVTHCDNDRSEYEQYVLQEYLNYRMFNVLTDLSFRARLARITYANSESDDEPITRYAFFIEDDAKMAVRNGWDVLEVPQVAPWDQDPDQLSLAELYLFMVGAVDWSPFMPEPGEDECCHNVTVIGNPAGPVFAVPYDFDLTGIISPRYAPKPPPNLGIRRLRDRLYRGVCKPEDVLQRTVALFNQKKDEIYAVYREQEGLDAKVRDEAIEYLDEFYEIINDQRKLDREITRRCREF